MALSFKLAFPADFSCRVFNGLNSATSATNFPGLPRLFFDQISSRIALLRARTVVPFAAIAFAISSMDCAALG